VGRIRAEGVEQRAGAVPGHVAQAVVPGALQRLQAGARLEALHGLADLQPALPFVDRGLRRRVGLDRGQQPLEVGVQAVAQPLGQARPERAVGGEVVDPQRRGLEQQLELVLDPRLQLAPARARVDDAEFEGAGAEVGLARGF
jgi:hypothetical protein